MSRRRATHNDTAGGDHSSIKIRLLSGKTIRMNHPGPLPSVLLLEADQDSAPGARIACRRVDVSKYRQMTAKEMVEAGLIKRRTTESSAEAKEGGAAEAE